MRERVVLTELPGDFIVAYTGEGAAVYRFETVESLLEHLRDPVMSLTDGFTPEAFDDFLSDPDNWDYNDSDEPHRFNMDVGEMTRMQLFCNVMKDNLLPDKVELIPPKPSSVGGVKLVLHPGALERLVGNDNELRVRMTHAALESFAHTHLKALLNTTVWEETVERERQFIRAELAKLSESLRLRPPSAIVNDASISWLRNMIQDRAKQAVDEVFQAMVKTKADEYVEKAVKEIAFRVESQIGFVIKQRVKDGVDEQLKGIQEALAAKGEKDKS